MPSSITLRSGVMVVSADSHDELVSKIATAVGEQQHMRVDTQTVVTTEIYSGITGGRATLVIYEIAVIADRPTRPRI